MDKKTVKSDGPPGIDVQLKGGQLVLSPVKKMFAACAKKVKAKCYLNGMRTEVTNELVKECFAAVKNFKQDLQPLLNKIFDGTWVDSDTHRKTKIRLAIQIGNYFLLKRSFISNHIFQIYFFYFFWNMQNIYFFIFFFIFLVEYFRTTLDPFCSQIRANI